MAIGGLIETHDSDEQRGGARRTVRLVAEGVRADGGQLGVRLHNISSGGLLLESEARLEIGEEIAIDLPEAGPVAAQVTWRSASLHGCRFTHPLPDSVLSAAQLKSAIAPPAAQGRPGLASGSLGARLASLRQERGLTLAQVADALGVSKPTVWAWEHDRAQPVARRIGAIARLFEVSEAELVTGNDLSEAEQAIENARRLVAKAYGCAPHQVRIMLDL